MDFYFGSAPHKTLRAAAQRVRQPTYGRTLSPLVIPHPRSKVVVQAGLLLMVFSAGYWVELNQQPLLLQSMSGGQF